MNEIISSLISALTPSSLPVVALSLGALYLWFKFGRVARECEDRGRDNKKLSEDVLKLQFKVSELDGRTVHQAGLLEDLRTQVATLNTNISELSVQLKMYFELLKKNDK